MHTCTKYVDLVDFEAHADRISNKNSLKKTVELVTFQIRVRFHNGAVENT